MDLYILRHGKAEPFGRRYPSDHTRPLAPKGRRRTELSVRGMKAANVNVDRIVSSPLLRARQTAEIVHEGLGLTEEIEFSDALASGNLGRIIAAVQPHSWRNGVMLVGHEPTLSELISMMASGLYHVALDLKPGGLCKLRVDAVRLGQCASIEWFLNPRQLTALR